MKRWNRIAAALFATRNIGAEAVAIEADERRTDRARARGIRVAGLAIILLGAGALFLPAEKGISSDVIGAMLVAAGLIEQERIPSSVVWICSALPSCSRNRCASASPHGALTRPPNGACSTTRTLPVSSRNCSATSVRSSGTIPVAARCSRA